MNNEQREAYFARLGLAVPEKFSPTGENLRKLHRLHSMIIPYENTDYLTGEILSPAPEVQFEEIICKKRGGMCLDVNMLFAEFLRDLGYEVRVGAAKICRKPADSLNWHVVFQATDAEGGNWWCDVANPFAYFAEPVPMGKDPFREDGQPFCCRVNEDGMPEIEECRDGVWEKQFELLSRDVTVSDTEESKYGEVTRHPEDAVFQKEVFSLGTPFGRRSLTGNLYRESFGKELVKLECPESWMPWAYGQFGLGGGRCRKSFL